MKKMKTLFALVLVLTLTVTLFVGCAGGAPAATPTPAAPTPAAPADPGTPTDTPDVDGVDMNWPTSTVYLVVTFSAGGGNDLIARAIAAGMETLVDQPVIVNNITGAGGITGSFEVVNANPDGHTILVQDSSLTSALITQGAEVPFTLDDLIPVASVYTCPTWVLAHTDRGYTTLQDFIDDARANPGELTIGTAVTTGSQYLMALAIVNHFDLDVIVIPYAGGAELRAAVLGNHVNIGIVHSPIMLPEVQEGLTAVLAAGAELTGIADESLRNVPTLADYGIDVEFTSTRGFLVPVGTPPEVIRRIEMLLEAAVETDIVAQFAEGFAFKPLFLNQAEYTELLRRELVDFGKVFDTIME